MTRRVRISIRGLLVALAASFALLLAACRRGGGGPAPALPAARVIERHADSLMAIPGVVGVYEGLTRGRTVIRVMLATQADSTVRRVPRWLDGYPVEVEVSGPIEPMRR
jgi:hypothetical protein